MVDPVSKEEAAGMLRDANATEPWLVRNADLAMAEHMTSIIQTIRAGCRGEEFLREIKRNAKEVQKAVNALRRLLPVLIYYERKADLARSSEWRITYTEPASVETQLLAAVFAAHGHHANELEHMLNALVDVQIAFNPKGAGWHWAARWLLNAYRENVATGGLGRTGPTVSFIRDGLERCGLGRHDYGAIEVALRSRATPKKPHGRRGSRNTRKRGKSSGETGSAT